MLRIWNTSSRSPRLELVRHRLGVLGIADPVPAWAVSAALPAAGRRSAAVDRLHAMLSAMAPNRDRGLSAG